MLHSLLYFRYFRHLSELGESIEELPFLNEDPHSVLEVEPTKVSSLIALCHDQHQELLIAEEKKLQVWLFYNKLQYFSTVGNQLCKSINWQGIYDQVEGRLSAALPEARAPPQSRPSFGVEPLRGHDEAGGGRDGRRAAAAIRHRTNQHRTRGRRCFRTRIIKIRENESIYCREVLVFCSKLSEIHFIHRKNQNKNKTNKTFWETSVTRSCSW